MVWLLPLMAMRAFREALLLFTALVAAINPPAYADEGVRVPRVLVDRGDASEQDSGRLPLVLTRELEQDARAPAGGPVRWLKLSGETIPEGAGAPPGGIRLRAVGVGRYSLPLVSGAHEVVVVRAGAFTSQGVRAERASPARDVPAALVFGGVPSAEEEVTQFVVAATAATLPTSVTVTSINAEGSYADSLRAVPLVSVKCPAELRRETEDLDCGGTPPLRLVTDLAERAHPSISGKGLLGEIGGHLLLQVEGADALRLPVLAPLNLEPEGPGRYRVRLRAHVVRTFPGGPPAVGDDDDDARSIVREEIASASRMWGQCGIHLGPPGAIEVRVVDPPVTTMLTVGCGLGLPASGGTIRFLAEKREIFLRTHDGESPRRVATRLGAALRRAGITVKLFANHRAGDAALASYDLLMTSAKGEPVRLQIPPEGPSDDSSLGICEGRLDLADGLEHFSDLDAATGTSEERYLLRSLSDDDPATIELLVIPLFAGLGRIGESFIHTRGGSLESALILDRTGVRAGARSFTLAHELGHILLDLPGHPDDFGVDTPSSLMDADAADSTIFGPRRLSLADCQRALRQSGRDAPVPLIFDWPLLSEKSVATGE